MSAATERAAQALLIELRDIVADDVTLEEARAVIDRLEDAGVLILSESGRRT